MSAFTVERKSLAEAVAKAASVSRRHAAKPILANLLLHCDGNRISIHGTDLERYVKVEVECEGDDCEVLVNAERLSAIARAANGEQITFREKDRGVEITSGPARWRVQTENPGDFPKPPKMRDGASLQINSLALCNAMSRVAFCTDPNSSRFALGGILIESEGGKLCFVATDGCRLALCELPVDAGEFRALPADCIGSLTPKIIGDAVECTVSTDSSWVSIVGDDGSELLVKQVDGLFPKYRDVIPRKFKTSVDLPVSATIETLRQSLLIRDEETVGGISLTFAAGNLRIESRNKTGEALSELPITHLEDFAVELRGPYLLEALASVDEDTVEFNFLDSRSAVALVWGNCRHVIMPLDPRRK